MKSVTQICLRISLFAILLLASTFVFAQPNDSSLFEEVTDTPINTGLALMAVAGIGYGLKKLNQRKK